MADRPHPAALWRQATDEIDAACRAGGDPMADPGPRYRELMREHGHLVPLEPGENRNLPCGWPGERAEDLDGVRLAAAEAYPDDEAQGEVVVLRRTELFEFMGRYMLPAEGDSASVAEVIADWVDSHRL